MRWIALILFSVNSFSFAQRSDFKDIDFKKADSIAYVHQNESLENLPILTHNLTAHLPTDVEKFRAIYTWVSISIENDYSSYMTTKKKRKKLSDKPAALREWNNSFTPKVFKNLIKYKKTACTGYAYLIRELATLAGIKSDIVDGYGRTATLLLDTNSIPNHSWNKVQLNGKWYLCDATWSAGKIIIDDDGARFEQDYFDGYFLAEPELFIKNHYPLEIGSALLSRPPTLEEFLIGPVVYKEAFIHSLIPMLPVAMHKDVRLDSAVEFSLKGSDSTKALDVRLKLVRGTTSTEVYKNPVREGDVWRFNHSFEKKGTYDVHLTYNEKLIATYVITVKR